MNATPDPLLENLNDFDTAVRGAALKALAPRAAGWPPAPSDGNVNLHMHSFFSYNAEGWSPTRLAWESRRMGLAAAGLCDFDVLDGLEEFLAVAETLGLRATVNLETRAYVAAYAAVDISSPGEPGVTYIMGAGFPGIPPADSPAGRGLEAFRGRAHERNRALLGRINPHMGPVAVDYATDVLPLTPAGNATERHIVSAFVNKAMAVFEHPRPVAAFWAALLDQDLATVIAWMADRPVFEEHVRGRLAKRGGLGYAPPSPDTFPPVESFVTWVRACGAVPMITWLDGTSAGEADTHALLEAMTAQGCEAVNIIPERNWNLSDPAARERKRARLRDLVNQADAMDLPINIGTEMNRDGLPRVDDLHGEVLRAYRPVFLKGARVMVGHQLLARYAGFGYPGEAAREAFPNRAARNAFFAALGAMPPLTTARARELRAMGPAKALDALRRAVATDATRSA